MQIDISDETAKLIIEARTRRPWFEEESDDGIIFHILTDWLSMDGKQTVDDWIREMF